MNKPLLPSEKEVLLWQDKSEKAVLKALERHYKTALQSMEQRIAELLARNDANLPHVIRRIEYQRMIKAQVKAAIDMLHAQEYETIEAYIRECYTDAFVGNVYTAETFKDAFNTNGVDVTVTRNIPTGSGMGGSSADIVGVLKAMQKLFKIDCDLKPIADSLGSDTGYLLTGGFARLYGRGEIVEPLVITMLSST